MMAEALSVRNLSLSFGSLQATRDVTLSLPVGARAALIGPNGAGKTTLVNLMSGALKPSSGTVFLGKTDVTGVDQAGRARLGLMRSFQITRLFKSMTVADNLRISILQRGDRSLSLFRNVKRVDGLEEEVYQALHLLGLNDRADKRITELAYGEQRLVELAIAVAAKPRVLLLDEPAAGVPQSESSVIVRAVEQLPKDLAILLIEHDMDLVFRLASHITVLVAGGVLMQGTPNDVANDERVRQLYLGEKSNGSH